MMTIKVEHVADDERQTEDFFKSLSYSHSDKESWEVIADKKFPQDKITFVDAPSGGTEIIVTLPDNCIVLGNSWDLYLRHALDKGLPQHGLGQHFVPTWEGYVQNKMGLQSRRLPEGVFPELKVEFPHSRQVE